MTETEGKYFLENYKRITYSLKVAKQQVVLLMQQVAHEKDSDLRQLSLPGKGEMIGGATFKSNGNDLVYAVVEKYEKILKEKLEHIQQELDTLSEEDACITLLFHCLYTLEEPYRSILLMTYIDGEKFDVITRELSVTNNKLLSLRKKGICLLVKSYNTGASVLEQVGEEKLLYQIEIANQLELDKAIGFSELKKSIHHVEGQMDLFSIIYSKGAGK